MSKKYDNSRDVPTEALTNRLYELSDAVTCGQKGLDSEFTMRIPPECDRDADLVLAESARRLRATDTALAAAEARIAELESYNVGLATESHQQQERIAALEKALDQLHDAASEFSADQSIAADPRCAVTQPVTVEDAHALNAALSVAAALLKEKE